MSVTVESSLRPLSGWGRTTPTTALVRSPVDASSVLASFDAHPGGVIARGLGRSYGDAAQCSGGLTIDTVALSHIGALDQAAFSIEVGGGVILHDLMQRLIPAGWFVAVTPGTRYVTVGGAIAADVHGKNHHRDGSFARHVVEMSLATPSGPITVSPDRDSELFWATAGGMGLTGVVVSAVLRLIPIETSWMRVDTQRFTRLENLMSNMEETDFRYHYSVAWLDCVGGRNGDHRSVLTRGDHAPSDAIPDRLRGRSREVPGDPVLRVPRSTPRRLVNRLSVRALNEAWFRASRESRGSLRPLAGFFHPLDGVGRWNPLRSTRVRAVPVRSARRAGRCHRGRRRLIASSGIPSFLAVLKRFGPGTPGPLSFSQRAGPSHWISRSVLPTCPPYWTASTIPSPMPVAGCTWPRTPDCDRSSSRSCTHG